MIAPEAIDNFLKNQIVRIIAAVGFLTLISLVFSSLLFNLGDLVNSTSVFDGFWNLTYIGVISTLATLGIWVGLSVTRRFEQPWWMIVAGAFGLWELIVEPVAFDLPDVMRSLLAIAGVLLLAAGAILALPTLDRATPKLAAPVAGYTGGQPQQSYPGQFAQQAQAAAEQAQPQPVQGSGGGQAPGWYPDPQGQAQWRWWDGTAWTQNTN